LLLVGWKKPPTKDNPITPGDDWIIFDLSYQDAKECSNSKQGFIAFTHDPIRIHQNTTREPYPFTGNCGKVERDTAIRTDGKPVSAATRLG
jgi:hypothetical protein